MTIYEGFIGFKFVYALGWTIVHSLWQCGVIGLILAIVLFLGGKLNSNTRYWLSFAALLLCVASSATTFFIVFRSITEVHLAMGVDALAPGMLLVIQSNTGEAFTGISHLIEQNVIAVVALWTIGCLAYFIKYLAEFYYCHTIRNTGTADLPEIWQTRIKALHGRAGLTREVVYKASHRVTIPCVIGHFKPVVLLPIGMLNGLGQDQVEVILLHEIGHIRRNDYLLGLVQAAIKILYFFNPAALWISSNIDRERENASDDFAVQISGDVLLYAKTLKELIEMNTKTELAMAVTKNKYHLLTRITRLFERKTVSPNPLQGLVAALCVALCFSVVSVYAEKAVEENQIEITQITTLSSDRVGKLFALAKAQQQKGDGITRFDLAGNPDYEMLSDGEKLFFSSLFYLSETPAFSHLGYEDALTAFQLTKQGDYSSFSAEAREIVILRPKNSSEELAKMFLYPKSNQYQVMLSPSLIESMRLGEVASMVHENGLLVEMDKNGAIILTMTGNKINGKNLKRSALELTEAVADIRLGRGFDPKQNPGRLTAFSTAAYLPMENAENYKLTDEDALNLYVQGDIAQIQVPRKVIDYLRSSSEPEVGGASLGARFDNKGDLVVTVDVDASQAASKQLRTYISDEAISGRMLDADMENRLSNLSVLKKQYLYTEEEYRKFRLAMSKSLGRPVGENEFSYVKTAYLKYQVEFLESLSDDQLPVLLKQPQFYVGNLAAKTRIMVREPIHETSNPNVFAMEVYDTPLETVVEKASDHCPDKASEVSLSEPGSRVTVEFSNLTCEQAFDVFEALDVSYHTTN